MSDRAEVREMVEKAGEFYLKSGRRMTLSEFNNCDGPFVAGEIYVFVLDEDGVMLAHGGNERYIGQDFLNQKDTEGKLFIREILETAKTEGSGWVEYIWFEPLSRTWLPKVTYFEKVEDVIICSGFYVHDPAFSRAKTA